MTVIFSKRNDTMFLQDIWKDLPDVKVVAVESMADYDKAAEAMQNEHDTLILCGHGTSEGLLFPDFMTYIVDEGDVQLLQGKTIYCIWCYASDFVKRHNLRGFATDMFVSDKTEAIMNNLYDNLDTISKENTLFANRLNACIKSDVSYMDWPDILFNQASLSDFVQFNYFNLYSF